MSEPIKGPHGVGPVNSLSSLSDLNETISDMSLSTSPDVDNPSATMKGSVLANPTSPSDEVFGSEEPPRPRKRLVMRQLSSNPYLASAEMSPDDLSHSLIIGSNSYAGVEASSERLEELCSDRLNEAMPYRPMDVRSNSFPPMLDFFSESTSESDVEGDDCEVEEKEDRAKDVAKELPSFSIKNTNDNTDNFNSSSEVENTCTISNSRQEDLIPIVDTNNSISQSVSLRDCDAQPISPSQSHRQKQGCLVSDYNHCHSSYSHTNTRNGHNIHQFISSSHGMVNDNFNKCTVPPSSTSYQYSFSHRSQFTTGPLPHLDNNNRHHNSSAHYTSQPPQSREINSWGHFYKQTDSHYKYRRSHYNSSDSDEENFKLYTPGKTYGSSSHKPRQVSHSHRHKPSSHSQMLLNNKSRMGKSQNQNSSDTKLPVVGVKPQVFKDRFQVVKRWFTECNDGQKNVILKGLLNLCELPQLHLLSVHMARELHQGCPSNCEDMLTWLPTNLATKIMTYLDPVSLCRAAQVCRVWRQLAEDQSLWRRFCCQSKWRLSKAAEHKQVISHMSLEGSIQWKNVFAERFRLRNNWLKGRCTVRTFEGHMQGISCVQFDDSRIVSGSSDKTIKVWNMRTNAPWSVQTLMGHHGTVRCLHLDGNRLVSGSCDTTIKVWDLSTQESWSSIACKVTMTGHTETVRCLQADDDKVISGSYDKTLKIWDLKSGSLRRTLRGHHGSVLCVHFSETKIVSGSKDKTIKLWNYDGQCTMTLRGHQDAVTCLMFDSTRIVSGSLDHNLKFWDVHSGECLNTIDWKKAEGHTGVVRCLQADSWRVVSAADDKTIKVWNLATGERLVTLRNHTDGVTCLQFNDFIIVSGSYDKSVKLWDFTCC